MDTKRHSTATFDTLRNFNRICLDKSIGSEAVDINKLMPLSLVLYLQSRLFETVDNVLFFENCYPDISVLPYN